MLITARITGLPSDAAIEWLFSVDGGVFAHLSTHCEM